MNELFQPPCKEEEILLYEFKLNFEGLSKYITYLNTICSKAYEGMNEIKTKIAEVNDFRDNIKEFTLKMELFTSKIDQMENTVAFYQDKFSQLEKNIEAHDAVYLPL